MPTGLRRYDQPGHIHFWTISCFRRLSFFHDDGMKHVAVEGLGVLQERFGVCLVGYGIMPDHVHVMVYPHARGQEQPIPVSRLLAAFKQHVGYHGKARLREVWRRQGRLWSEPLNRWASGALGRETIWNTRGYVFNILRREALVTKLDYCHKNPVTRGLVERPEEWPWSSYRFYELGDPTVLKMDWDGDWPIMW